LHLIAVEISISRMSVAIACAVVCAFSYALSNVLQQHEAEQIPEEQTLKLGLIGKLAHRLRKAYGIIEELIEEREKSGNPWEKI